MTMHPKATWTCPTCGAIYQTPVEGIPGGELSRCRNRGCPGKPRRR